MYNSDTELQRLFILLPVTFHLQFNWIIRTNGCDIWPQRYHRSLFYVKIRTSKHNAEQAALTSISSAVQSLHKIITILLLSFMHMCGSESGCESGNSYLFGFNLSGSAKKKYSLTNYVDFYLLFAHVITCKIRVFGLFQYSTNSTSISRSSVLKRERFGCLSFWVVRIIGHVFE